MLATRAVGAACSRTAAHRLGARPNTSGVRRLLWGDNVVAHGLDGIRNAERQPGECGRDDRRTQRPALEAGHPCSGHHNENDFGRENGAQAEIIVGAQPRDQKP